jgi:hypothetical protein
MLVRHTLSLTDAPEYARNTQTFGQTPTTTLSGPGFVGRCSQAVVAWACWARSPKRCAAPSHTPTRAPEKVCSHGRARALLLLRWERAPDSCPSYGTETVHQKWTRSFPATRRSNIPPDLGVSNLFWRKSAQSAREPVENRSVENLGKLSVEVLGCSADVPRPRACKRG